MRALIATRCLALIVALMISLCASKTFAAGAFAVLQPQSFSHYFSEFNSLGPETITNFIPNAGAAEWLAQEIPFFDCPDPEVQQIYYFRWWAFRKHLERTPDGFVFSEFLTRPTPTSSALGLQIAEGRWLNDPRYLEDYIRFWFKNDENFRQLHKYSGWLGDAVWKKYLADGDQPFAVSLLPDLLRDYSAWEKEHLTTNGLFWQFDVRDAMEESISGSRTNQNLRPTINSYMYGSAMGIANLARLAGNQVVAVEFDRKAARLRQLVESSLWNPNDKFYEVRRDNGELANVRELLGYLPWMFELPEKGAGREEAWAQMTDPEGFLAPYGLATAERRSPWFRTHGYGHCEWDGAVWPYATSQTLAALANVLRDYPQTVVGSRDYFEAFLTYVQSQHAGGKPYIGEYLDETTGQWINGKAGRSKDYNHSTFADLVITGIAGVVPRADNMVEVWPLLPEGVWPWFCLDHLSYHGHALTIIWDEDGRHYKHGTGLVVMADGRVIGHSGKLEKILAPLP